MTESYLYLRQKSMFQYGIEFGLPSPKLRRRVLHGQPPPLVEQLRIHARLRPIYPLNLNPDVPDLHQSPNPHRNRPHRNKQTADSVVGSPSLSTHRTHPNQIIGF